jgi:hypothetical protein
VVSQGGDLAVTRLELYAAVGQISGELITYGGKVLVHPNRHEMEYLLSGVKIVRCPSYVKPSERSPLKNHTDLSDVRWPLRKEDFRE